MLLNIFFTNANAAAKLVLIGVFILGMYWFVLRKYNSLGLRMFALCFFVFAACCVWLYNDEVELKTIFTNGEGYIASIISKTKTGNAVKKKLPVAEKMNYLLRWRKLTFDDVIKIKMFITLFL